MILLSVIVPVYKVQDYLNECLDSILTQSYKNLEIIIVDDGSPDDCPAICDAYASKDRRVKVIHQINKGLSQARNTGVRASSGQYIMFVDSDDKLCDNYVVENLVDFLNKTRPIVTYCTDTLRFDQDGIVKEPEQFVSMLEPKVGEEHCILGADDLLPFVRQNHYCLAAWSFVIQRDYFIRHSLFFYPGIYFEDQEWIPRLLFTQPDLKVNVFSKPFYFYRNNPSSITKKFEQHHFESFVKILELYKRHLQTLVPNLYIKDMFNTILYCMFIFFEKPCLTNAPFYKSNRPVILSLFRQNYKLLNTRNKILYLFIIFCPKGFFVLRRLIKKLKLH